MDHFGSRRFSGPCVCEKKFFRPPSLPGNVGVTGPRLGSGGEKGAVGEDVETLKRRLPLLEYLRQHNWKGSTSGPIRVCWTLSAARRDPALVLCQHAQKCLLLSRLRPGRRPDSLRPVVPPSVLPSEPRLSGSADHR